MGFISVFVLALTGCASVELSLPTLRDKSERAEASQMAERANLRAALHQLENHPWAEADHDGSAGLVGLMFGGGAPTAKAQAQSYLASLGDSPATRVRMDLESTLAAAWNVAYRGQEATHALEPLPSDLRTIESAIVEARHCRLVYAEALTMLARDDTSVTREEVRRVKERFNQAIMELGRTADALSLLLQRDPGAKTMLLSEARL